VIVSALKYEKAPANPVKPQSSESINAYEKLSTLCLKLLLLSLQAIVYFALDIPIECT
jgi:hypothetical protein